jgi:hypothetical protein
MFSCTDNTEMGADNNQIITRAKPTKVTICHYNPGNDTYKTRTINEKQLDKHLAHGDYEGACDDAVLCDSVCIFCAYIDLMDFDEPCPENPFNYGDNLCTQYTPDPNCPANPNFGSWEYSLWDRDKNRNDFCGGTDDENDAGVVSVFWEKHCDGSFFGQVSIFYDDGIVGTPDIFYEEFGATEADYNKALFCKSILEGIVTDLGLTDACGEITPPCDSECLFCDYINLLDFDEPCPENPFNYGDNLCTQYTPDPICPANPNFGSWEYSLWDRDKNRNDFCDGTDDENDAGVVSVFWEKHCDGSFFGQVSIFYDDGIVGTPDIFYEDFGATEADYNKALNCKSILESIATELGLTDACPD